MPIAEPTGDPQAQGWYVLDVTDSQTDYIMAHLAVTSAGLWVLPSGIGQAQDAQHANGYKVLLSNSGMTVYDGSGQQVVTYGESISFSSSRPQYIGGEDAHITYYDSDDDGVPDSIYIGGSNVTIGGKTLSQVTRAVDACFISLTSTNGTVFKQNLGVSTSIIATIFANDGERITTTQQLAARYGVGAYIQWRWKDTGTGDFVTLSSDDPRISAGGFVLTVSPEDVSTQAVIDCELVY